MGRRGNSEGSYIEFQENQGQKQKEYNLGLFADAVMFGKQSDLFWYKY